jgi:Ni2+-binding GTPase involved in maturation of urease and hydrogenase
MLKVIVVGHPASGKTIIANTIANALKAQGIKTVVVDDPGDMRRTQPFSDTELAHRCALLAAKYDNNPITIETKQANQRGELL